jgi:lipopolysaccharide/colanic/teichoic acid biosynthesis glycosyltransferase
MAKRLFDILLSLILSIPAVPLISIAIAGVALSSPGPVFYQAARIGKGGREFRMFKVRTMHVAKSNGSRITSSIDNRVFGFGRLLRQMKLDELPQLWNILKGDMSYVGPRPEDPAIVSAYYSVEYRETLTVTPGLASPGSIFNYTHGQGLIGTTDPERDYVQKLLPIKMQLERYYVRNSSFMYDFRILVRTFIVIVQRILGRRNFSLPPELVAMNIQLHEVGDQRT